MLKPQKGINTLAIVRGGSTWWRLGALSVALNTARPKKRWGFGGFTQTLRSLIKHHHLSTGYPQPTMAKFMIFLLS